MEMSEICRLCLETTKKGVSINYTDSNNFSVLAGLNLVVPEFKLKCPKDAKICMQCYPLLLLSYKFRTKCLKTELVIIKYLEQHHCDPETLPLTKVLEWHRGTPNYSLQNQIADRTKSFTESTKTIEKSSKSEESHIQPVVLNHTFQGAISVRPLMKTYSKKTNIARFKKKDFIPQVIEHPYLINVGDPELRKPDPLESTDGDNSPCIDVNTEYSVLNQEFLKDFKNIKIKKVDPLVKNKIKIKTSFEKKNSESIPIISIDKLVQKKTCKLPSIDKVGENSGDKTNDVNILDTNQKSSNCFDTTKVSTINQENKDQCNKMTQGDTCNVRSEPELALKTIQPIKPQDQSELTLKKISSLPMVRVRPVEVLNSLYLENNPDLTSKSAQEADPLYRKRSHVSAPTDDTSCLEKLCSVDILLDNFEEISIKEEPPNLEENTFQKNPLQNISHDAESDPINTLNEPECISNKVNQIRDTSFHMVEGLINALPEIGEEFDQPEYIAINKVSFKDMALLLKASVGTQSNLTLIGNQKNEGHIKTLKRVRLVSVGNEAERHIKKQKTEKVTRCNTTPTKITSTDEEKDVCVLYTNFTSTGDYINDHDYLINPYERNNILPLIEGQTYCICLLCNVAHESEGHVEHMKSHNSICEVCNIDFHNVFILNIHVKTHTTICHGCNTKISYKMHKEHSSCQHLPTPLKTNCSDTRNQMVDKLGYEAKKEEKTSPEPPEGNETITVRRSKRLKHTKRKFQIVNDEIERIERTEKSTKELQQPGTKNNKIALSGPRTIIRRNNGGCKSYIICRCSCSSDQHKTGHFKKECAIKRKCFEEKPPRLKRVKYSSTRELKYKLQKKFATTQLDIPQGNLEKLVLAKTKGKNKLKAGNIKSKVTLSKSKFCEAIPRFEDRQFKQHFRISRKTFQDLIEKLHSTTKEATGCNITILEKELSICLWYLGTLECLSDVAARFNATSFTLEVLSKICLKISDMDEECGIIKWPSEEQSLGIITEFEKICGFPGVIGCIKGHHIKIPAYRNTKDRFDHKMYHSVYLQGVCDHRKLFTDIYLSQPRSLPTATLFEKSDLGFKNINNSKYIFPNNSHIIGDVNFKLNKHLLVEYRDVLDNRHRAFNQKLSKTRAIVDKAFALLRGRFVRLKYMDARKIDFIFAITKMACVLHNLCILNDDTTDDIMNLRKELLELDLKYVDQGPLEETDTQREFLEKRDNILSQIC